MSNKINKHNVAWLYLAIMCFIVFGLYAVMRFRFVNPDASLSGLLTGWDMDKLRMLGIYVLFVNVVTFALFSWDKHVAASARGHGSRTPEAYLLGFCLAGGSVGGMAAMGLVRHKTKKWYFVWGLPLFMLMDVALVFFAHLCGMIQREGRAGGAISQIRHIVGCRMSGLTRLSRGRASFWSWGHTAGHRMSYLTK